MLPGLLHFQENEIWIFFSYGKHSDFLIWGQLNLCQSILYGPNGNRCRFQGHPLRISRLHCGHWSSSSKVKISGPIRSFSRCKPPRNHTLTFVSVHFWGEMTQISRELRTQDLQTFKIHQLAEHRFPALTFQNARQLMVTPSNTWHSLTHS